MPLTPLRLIILAIAALPSLYYLAAIYSAWRHFRTARQPPGEFMPGVSVLKPVRGLDPGSYENFASFCRQDYGEYEIVFAVADEDDPAIEIIRRLIEDFPRRSIRLLIGAPNVGPSSKVNKLCRLAREARHDILVISDSDIRVASDYLRSVVAPFRDPRVGAVTCLYTGITNGTIASELEALGIATDFAPGVLTAWRFQGLRFALGATMATTRDRLREIGGFEALVAYCADDYQLGCRIAERGYIVELPQHIVESECAVRTLREYVQHQLRWAITIRHSRPWGYAGLVLTHGLLWAAAATAVMPTAAIASCYVTAYLTLRLLMAWSVARWGPGGRVLRRWWLLPVRDALGLGVWCAALFKNRIRWRGREFALDQGRLVPLVADRAVVGGTGAVADAGST
jgi:ceramide glucosyltransferase